jgi:DNA-binding LytR/AlgR family response regulator
MYNELRTHHPERAQILNIKIGNKRKIVPVEEICWIESDDYCVKVHTINDKTFTMRSSLKSLEEQLQGNFMRVHRTAIVNLDYTKEISYAGNPNLTLQNNTCVPIAKSKIRALRSQLS